MLDNLPAASKPARTLGEEWQDYSITFFLKPVLRHSKRQYNRNRHNNPISPRFGICYYNGSHRAHRPDMTAMGVDSMYPTRSPTRCQLAVVS
jgi:hypothetical protein